MNCGPTGSETLKNLVLGGVGSITVVDGSKVEIGDLGNNFMVDESRVGQSKAKTVCAFLQELNDAVKAKFIEEYPEKLIDSNPAFFSQFTLVVATQVCSFCTFCYVVLFCTVELPFFAILCAREVLFVVQIPRCPSLAF